MLPDRIAIAKIPRRQRLIDTTTFALSAESCSLKTLAKPESACREEIWISRIEQPARDARRRTAHGDRPRRNLALPISCQRNRADRRRRDHAGHGADLFDRLPVEIHSAPSRSRISRPAADIRTSEELCGSNPVRARPSSSRLLIVSPAPSAEPRHRDFALPPENFACDSAPRPPRLPGPLAKSIHSTIATPESRNQQRADHRDSRREPATRWNPNPNEFRVEADQRSISKSLRCSTTRAPTLRRLQKWPAPRLPKHVRNQLYFARAQRLTHRAFPLPRHHARREQSPTFVHAISSTNATAPASASTVGRKSRTTILSAIPPAPRDSDSCPDTQRQPRGDWSSFPPALPRSKLPGRNRPTTAPICVARSSP